jgi:hypothetical protein
MKGLLIAIVTMNRRDDLRQCLGSIRASENPVGDILIIDNNSTDGTPEMVLKAYPDVRLIRNRDNIGCAAARNQAFKYGIEHDYRYVQLLDDDVIVGDRMIEKLVAAMKGTEIFGMAAPTLCDARRPEFVYWGGGTFAFKIGFQCGNKGKSTKELEALEPVETDWVLGGVSLVACDTIRKVGYLNDRMGLFGAEDYEYSLRVRRTGIKICWVPSAVAYHQFGGGNPDDRCGDTAKIYYNWYTLYKIYFSIFGVTKIPCSLYVLSRRLKWQLDEYFSRGNEEQAAAALSAFWDIVRLKKCQPSLRCPGLLFRSARWNANRNRKRSVQG